MLFRSGAAEDGRKKERRRETVGKLEVLQTPAENMDYMQTAARHLGEGLEKEHERPRLQKARSGYYGGKERDWRGQNWRQLDWSERCS